MFQRIEGKLILDEKLFHPISDDKLVIGNKYVFGCGFSGIYKRSYVTRNHTYKQFDKVCDLVYQKHHHGLFNSEFSKCYEFVSQQPQAKMERRAVNLIVRRLIGDDCFEW